MPAILSTVADLDDFARGYITCLLWSSVGDDDQPLDATYGPEDVAPETLARIVADCAKFQADNAADLEAGPARQPQNCTAAEYAGHDFWLTRCGHGCGFWDGDWPEEAGERLTTAAHAFGNVDPYVGDDGLIYL